MADMGVIEDWIEDREEVVAYTTFAGQGATRFMLTYAGEPPDPSYGHMIVRTEDIEAIPSLQDALEAFAAEALPAGEFRTRRLVFGPGGGNPIEVRFSGSGPAVLRALAEEAMDRLEAASSNIIQPRTDWREQELVLRPIYAADRAQTAGLDRDDIANTLRFATEGIEGGVYREGDRQIPIIVRVPASAGLSILDHVVHSDQSGRFVPLDQATDGLRFEVQNTIVHRRDRCRR